MKISPADVDRVPFQMAVHLMLHILAQGFVADKVGEANDDEEHGDDTSDDPRSPSASV